MPKGIKKIGVLGFMSCSELPNLYGCGYGTKYDVYARYKGIPAEKVFSDEAKKSLEFGQRFEDAVAQFFMYKTGLKVTKEGNGEMAYWKKERPFFFCHPDRIGNKRDSKGRRFALEIKCVRPNSDGWGEDGSSEIPDNYYLQVQGYFACGVPCDVVYVACMRGNRVYIYEILPDNDVIADIIKRVDAFKDECDHGIVPSSENYKESVTKLKRSVRLEAEGMPAGDAGRALWAEALENHKVYKEAEAKEDELKAKLVDIMGTCPSLITADDGKISIIAKLTTTHKKKFDADALKSDFPDIYTKYMKETVTDSVKFSFPVTKKEKKDGNE